MQQISSRGTFFYKRIFPAIWFGFLAFFLVSVVISANRKDGTLVFSLAVLAFMGGLGYFVMKKLCWDLADHVQDAGDSLIVRFGSDEERIQLSRITNVSYNYMVNPPRVTLSLSLPSQFGEEISFCAPIVLIPLTRSPIITDLIQRVHAARLAAS